jgi:hypothetical protein
MTATEALTEIHQVASRQRDCDVTALSCLTKIEGLAYDALPASRGRETTTLSAVYDVARSNARACSRLEAIAALCAQAREKVAA